jgi:hypothetical protein
VAKKVQQPVKGKKSRNYRLALWIILAAAFVIYSRSITNEILYGWDDGLYLQDPAVTEFNIGQIFSNYQLGMYQPVGVLTIAINYAISGDKPAMYHLTNILLHLLNIFLAYLLFSKFTGRRDLALIIAGLMAIHPMHVEAVSWMAARSTLLFTTFYLLALWYYVKFMEGKSWKMYGLTLLFFILSLFTKSMAVTLPVVLILFDIYKKQKFDSRALFEKLPFFALSVVFGIVAIAASRSLGHITELNQDFSIIDRLFLLSYGVWFYLRMLVAPLNLSAIYSYPFKVDGMLPLEYYLSLAFILLIVFLMFVWKDKSKVLFSGLFFFLITIAPVLPFYWSRIFIVGERYSYLTYIGLFWILGEVALYIYYSRENIIKKLKPAFGAVAAALLIFLAVTTFSRQKEWKSTFVLLTDVVDGQTEKWDIASGFFYRGNFLEMVGQTQNALTDYNLAIKYNPDYTLAYNNRGIIYGMQGKFDKALENFNKTIELDPEYSNAWHNRGLAYYQLNQPDSACADWRKARELGFAKAGEMLGRYCE